jgi:hypothetical protein
MLLFPHTATAPSARDGARASPNPAPGMMQRLAAAAVLCAGLASCKQDDGPIAGTLYTGIGPVTVDEAHIVPTGDSSANTSGGTLNYLLVRVTLLNITRADFVPQIDHFSYTDSAGNRFAGQDSGSSVFTGVSNSQQPLKINEKRDYTIGFRTTDPNTTGTISYDP